MKLNIKYIILTLGIIVCNSGNYINAMEVENKINMSNNIFDQNIINISNLNNINIINENNTIDDSEQNIFDENYNIEYYNVVCNKCIEDIKNIKPNYVRLMKDTSKIFDQIYKDIFKKRFLHYGKEININISSLSLFAEIACIFDTFNLNNNADDKLSNNSLEQLKKYSRNISLEKCAIYIRNQIMKLKAQTLQALAQSIMNTKVSDDILDTSLKKLDNKSLIYREIYNEINKSSKINNDIDNILLSIQKLKDNKNMIGENEEIQKIVARQQINDFIYDVIYEINKEQILIIRKSKKVLENVLERIKELSNSELIETSLFYEVLSDDDKQSLKRCLKRYVKLKKSIHIIHNFDRLYFTKSSLQETMYREHYLTISPIFNNMNNFKKLHNKIFTIKKRLLFA